MSITTMTFAARDFSARRGASDEHTLQGSVRNEQRSLAEKNCRPKGCAAFGLWLRCSSVTDPLRDMLPPRALPQAKLGATNAIAFMFMTTKRAKGVAFSSDRFEASENHCPFLLPGTHQSNPGMLCNCSCWNLSKLIKWT